MELELTYAKKEDVPEAHVELYTEADGKDADGKDSKVWNLTGVKGLVTKVDVDKLNVALGKERTDHKETKKKVAVWGDMDQTKVVKDLEELTELRAAAEAGEGGKDAKEKFEAGVKAAAEARIVAAKATSDREIADLKKAGGEKDERRGHPDTGYPPMPGPSAVHHGWRWHGTAVQDSIPIISRRRSTRRAGHRHRGGISASVPAPARWWAWPW